MKIRPASLGLVKSGIYKHYEGKEAIWNALPDRMIVCYGERFGSSGHLPKLPDFRWLGKSFTDKS